MKLRKGSQYRAIIQSIFHHGMLERLCEFIETSTLALLITLIPDKSPLMIENSHYLN